MEMHRSLRCCVVALSCASMLTTQLAYAAGPPSNSSAAIPTIQVPDVALQPGGVLRGQIANEQGTPQAGVRLALAKDGQAVAEAVSDAEGQFQVSGVGAGVYQVQTPSGSAVYRLWAPQTAPPSATNEVLIAPGQQVVRGRAHGPGFGLGHTHGSRWATMLANPWVLAGIAALAIALPLALSDDDDAS